MIKQFLKCKEMLKKKGFENGLQRVEEMFQLEKHPS
jgi:hypothetical protein